MAAVGLCDHRQPGVPADTLPGKGRPGERSVNPVLDFNLQLHITDGTMSRRVAVVAAAVQ